MRPTWKTQESDMDELVEEELHSGKMRQESGAQEAEESEQIDEV
jgi:hypothetical protein